VSLFCVKLIASIVLPGVALLFPLAAILAGQQTGAVHEGYVTTADGVRLYYQKVGTGPQVVLIPGRLFLFPAFQQLAEGRTLISYDMRDRGRSDTVSDPKRISIQDDVKDLETIRQHFHAEKPMLIGFSYLGMMVMLYATEHPDHVSRIVQLGPVARSTAEKFPASLVANDPTPVPDPAQLKELEGLMNNGFMKDHPKEFCEKDWQITRVRLVGNPANAEKLGPSQCEMPNEWPTHLYPHFQAKFTTIQALDISKEKIAALRSPVLTIHGTQDRNAAYGGGRQWSMLVSDGRLLTLPGAAHMSWVEFPNEVFSAIDTFLKGNWPTAAEKVKTMEYTPK
jgi:pimeloyl-ACP methyl ester carboxylesterase